MVEDNANLIENEKLFRKGIMISTHVDDDWERLIALAKSFQYYAYIVHDRDIYTIRDFKNGKCEEDKIGSIKHKHLTLIVEDSIRHYLSAWSKKFELPVNQIELIKDFRTANRYLIHKDHPDRGVYDISEVTTNCPLRFSSYLQDNSELVPRNLYYDILDVRMNRITIDDFIDKYKFQISKLSFYSQYKIYNDIINTKENLENKNNERRNY